MRQNNKHYFNVLIGWLYALSALVFLGALGIWLVNSDYFPIKHINIESTNGQFKYISQEELANAAKNSISGNIFHVNLNEVKAQFELLVWADDVSVRRVWPDTLSILVEEREPVAYWNKDDLLDSKGQVFRAPIDGIYPHFQGQVHTEKKMVTMYEEMRPILSRVGLSIHTLIYSGRSTWTLVLNNGVELRLGRNDTLMRLTRFVTYWPSVLKAQEARLQYVDMRYQDGFSVRHRLTQGE